MSGVLQRFYHQPTDRLAALSYFCHLQRALTSGLQACSRPSLDEVRSSQEELDDFFGAQHAPPERDALAASSSQHAATAAALAAPAEHASMDTAAAVMPPASNPSTHGMAASSHTTKHVAQQAAELTHVAPDGRASMVDVGHV